MFLAVAGVGFRAPLAAALRFCGISEILRLDIRGCPFSRRPPGFHRAIVSGSSIPALFSTGDEEALSVAARRGARRASGHTFGLVPERPAGREPGVDSGNIRHGYPPADPFQAPGGGERQNFSSPYMLATWVPGTVLATNLVEFERQPGLLRWAVLSGSCLKVPWSRPFR